MVSVVMLLICLVIVIGKPKGIYLDNIEDSLIYFVTPGEGKEEAAIEQTYKEVEDNFGEIITEVYTVEDPVQETLHQNINNVRDKHSITRQLLRIGGGLSVE